MEMKNQLGVLLEFPSLSWLETIKNHTQKDGTNRGMSSRDQENSGTT